MTLTDVIILALGCICFFLFLFSKRFKDYIKSMLLGVIAFAGVNICSIFTGTVLKASVASLSASVFFGIPGVIFSLIFDII